MSSVPSLFSTSQVHPDPKFSTALLENACSNSAYDPHLSLIACAMGPLGAVPPWGRMHFQKNAWFQAWAALLKIAPEALRTMSSSGIDANSVPLTSSFSLVT